MEKGCWVKFVFPTPGTLLVFKLKTALIIENRCHGIKAEPMAIVNIIFSQLGGSCRPRNRLAFGLMVSWPTRPTLFAKNRFPNGHGFLLYYTTHVAFSMEYRDIGYILYTNYSGSVGVD